MRIPYMIILMHKDIITKTIIIKELFSESIIYNKYYKYAMSTIPFKLNSMRFRDIFKICFTWI